MVRALSGLLVACLACATAGDPASPAPTPPPDAVRALQRRPSRATELTTALCDAAGPRLAGSDGETLGVAWALRTLTALGLENVHPEPVEQEPRWARGTESAALTSPRAQPLAVTALGGSPSTPPEGIEAQVLEVTSLEALEALAPGAAAGKIVFANVPMTRRADGSGYGQEAGVRRLAAKAGARAGAVAALIRSVGTDTNRLPHTGGQGVERSMTPAAALAIPDAELLHRLLTQGPVSLRLRLDTRHEAPTVGFNVVGEVTGRERPEELVLLGAHLDSWDLGVGALDDGA
ncbi:MAG: peptidase M28 family protein, partial [Myxococcaceae bacterium]|nr:peptidase M28 family protein [Myxococcaceae bacterium]